MEAGLLVFSQFGFRGSTLDQIATAAGMSKPNTLYYFETKEAIYNALLEKLLDDWLKPIHAIDKDGDPVEELLAYAKHKLRMSRLYPRESRLYAGEILQGAPRIGATLSGELREVVGTLVTLINSWIAAGLIRPVDPHHLMFSIWAMTQHYADFDVQIQAVLGEGDHFDAAERYIEDMLRHMLTVDA